MTAARTLTESTIRVWSPPTSRRRFRTKHAAFVAWAKDLIRARECGCDDGGSGGFREASAPFVCPWHRWLYEAPAFACTACQTPDETNGAPCGTCDRGRCTVPTTTYGNARYMRLRNRLARWLRWRSERLP